MSRKLSSVEIGAILGVANEVKPLLAVLKSAGFLSPAAHAECEAWMMALGRKLQGERDARFDAELARALADGVKPSEWFRRT